MDVLMQMTPNGGDLVFRWHSTTGVYDLGDFVRTDSLDNMPLLALFGGNREQSTPTQRNVNEKYFDWWGNSLMLDNPEAQFNSETERVMHSVALNSFGRVQIEEAIKRDLSFMKPFAQITVRTEILDQNILKINIKLIKPDNLEEKEFIFIWDKLMDTIVEEDYSQNAQPSINGGLQYGLQFNI